ncbi:MAG TPA: right-handed parallel beta-helix repeat-containing protein [Phycisphaerae bacterium]|nr:right-handed parallel beta-helix repeat-containing protein [Phycisphaerae bacterium]
MQRYRITVGDDSSDIRGFTNTHVQCAVDRVAMLGGGVVELSAGTFALADSIHLRSKVTLRGQGAATVLRKNAQKSSRINTYLGYGHHDVCVEEPDLFGLGEGIWLRDDKAGGFYTTVGTLVRRDGDVWFTSRPHRHDYHPNANAVAEALFPAISAYDLLGGVVELLAIDGNAAENPTMISGCRGGGVFAMRCGRLAVRRVTVRHYNGEGIGFQTCDDVEVADCLVEDCAGNGYHPGSGSNRFHVHDCVGRRNGASGLFYCLRVRDSLLEDCTFEANGLHGVSTGGRDSGNVNRGLALRGNAGCGFFFRKHDRNDAPHDNLIERCTFEGNAAGEGEAEVLVQGEVDGTRIVGNTFHPREGKPAVVIEAEALTVELADNDLPPGDGGIVDRRPSAG